MNTPLPVMCKLIPNHKVWNIKKINEKYELNTQEKYAIPVNEQNWIMIAQISSKKSNDESKHKQIVLNSC